MKEYTMDGWMFIYFVKIRNQLHLGVVTESTV